MTTIVEKGWGSELTYVNSPDYCCGRILHFLKNRKTSLHFHVHKLETLHVYKGEFIIRMIDPQSGLKKERHLTSGQTISIPCASVHQIEAITEGDILETSSFEDNSDKYRVEGGSTQEKHMRPTSVSIEGDLYKQEYTPSLTPSPNSSQ